MHMRQRRTLFWNDMGKFTSSGTSVRRAPSQLRAQLNNKVHHGLDGTSLAPITYQGVKNPHLWSNLRSACGWLNTGRFCGLLQTEVKVMLELEVSRPSISVLGLSVGFHLCHKMQHDHNFLCRDQWPTSKIYRMVWDFVWLTDCSAQAFI